MFIYNKNRYYKNKISAFSDVLRGIKLLKKYNIPFGVLSVISNDTYSMAEEIFDFFHSIEVLSVDFIPSYLPTEEKYNIDSEKWGDFLCNSFEIWINNPTFIVPYFEDIINKYIYLNKKDNSAKLCVMCELGDTYGENLSITSDGALYFCECLIGIKEFYIGNIKQKSLKKLMEEKDVIDKFIDMNLEVKECLSCRYYDLCKSGCLKHRLGHNNCIDYFCSAKKRIFGRVEKYIEEKQNGICY